MNRRHMIAALGGAMAWPTAARGQQAERMRRIGVLMPYPESDSQEQARVAVFREEQLIGAGEGNRTLVISLEGW